MKHCGICEMWDITREADYVAMYDNGKTVYLCESCSHAKWIGLTPLNKVEVQTIVADTARLDYSRWATAHGRYSRYGKHATVLRKMSNAWGAYSKWLAGEKSTFDADKWFLVSHTHAEALDKLNKEYDAQYA